MVENKNETSVRGRRESTLRHGFLNQFMRKIIYSLIAVILFYSPLFAYIQSASMLLSHKNSVEAASLAEVQLLSGVNIDAELSEYSEEYYNLNLNLKGTGLADAEAANPERTVVFYAPGLAGQMQQNGPSSVSVELTGINLENDLPLIHGAVGDLTGSLTGLITGLTTTLDNAINGTRLAGLVRVEGLDELNSALANLNNLDAALQDLTAYEDEMVFNVNEDGSIIITFSDGLKNHLDTIVTEIIESTLSDILTAVDNLDIILLGDSILLGPLLTTLVINPIVNPLVSTVTNTVDQLQKSLTSGTLNLSQQLAGVQVLGETEVTLNVLIDRPAGIEDETTVYGAGVNTTAIDVQLLNSLYSSDTISFDEDTTAPVLGSAEIEGDTEAGYIISGTGEEPGDTVNVYDSESVTVGTGTIDEDGSYSINVDGDAVDVGDELTVQAVDEVGNTSEPLTVTVPQDPDETPPELSNVTIEGSSEEDYEVTGATDPEAAVTVSNVDGNEVGAGVADVDGNFNVEVLADDVTPGEVLSVIATDENGNSSDPVNITVPEDPDETVPILSSANIAGNSIDGYEVFGDAEDPGDRVNVTNEAGKQVGTAVIDEDGSYSVTVPAELVNIGEELTVIAVDAAGNESDKLYVFVPVLRIQSVPENIVFQNTEINSGMRIIKREGTDYSIEIEDTRSSGQWFLNAQAAPLENEEGEMLPNALYYVNETEEIPITEEPREVANKEKNGNDTLQTIVWPEDEGILLKMNPIEASASSPYRTTIEWTLTDGPPGE